MKRQDQRIYQILAVLSLAGYAWVGYNLNDAAHTHATVCVFKGVTGIPCPSCGTTRSVLLLMQGDIAAALWTNPLGALALLLLAAIPVWIAYDLLMKRQTLLVSFRRAEGVIRSNKMLYLSLIVLIVANWGWNILKDL